TMTQAQIADFLQIKKQNINKYVVELTKMGLLEVDRIEGRNKFLKAVNTFPKASEPTNNIDQMTLFDN
ncbi:MAG: MarR family transcriptional regulator, partial [Lachnospiraceae bacterium]|nr:MarR family transcriptional regulator [Lachnospiraceae bacterium]